LLDLSLSLWCFVDHCLSFCSLYSVWFPPLVSSGAPAFLVGFLFTRS
jgi:hypothetical protein